MEGTKCRMQCLLQSLAWSGGSDEAGSFPLPDCMHSVSRTVSRPQVGLRSWAPRPAGDPTFLGPFASRTVSGNLLQQNSFTVEKGRGCSGQFVDVGIEFVCLFFL